MAKEITPRMAAEKVVAGADLTADEVKGLLVAPREELYEAAHQVTEAFKAKTFDFCAILNARCGKCSENCKWCAQSAHWKTGCDEWGLQTVEACVDAAKEAEAKGAVRFGLVTSGRTLSESDVVLHPIPGTPLGERPLPTEEDILTGVAILRLVNPKTPLRFAGGRRDMSDATAARAIYVGISAGIAGPLLTTPGADYADDRQLAKNAGYGV